MDIKNNYISVVCIGCFNPKILTHEFLKKTCVFKFDNVLEAQNTPVISKISYENIGFIVELERLQILEREIEHFSESLILEYFKNYIKILEYTPISVCGINFNMTLQGYNESLFLKRIKDNNFIVEIAKPNDMSIEQSSVFQNEGSKEFWKVFNLSYLDSQANKITINFKKDGKKIICNFNYEIKNLKNSREKLNNIRLKELEVVSKNIFKLFFQED